MGASPGIEPGAGILACSVGPVLSAWECSRNADFTTELRSLRVSKRHDNGARVRNWLAAESWNRTSLWDNRFFFTLSDQVHPAPKVSLGFALLLPSLSNPKSTSQMGRGGRGGRGGGGGGGRGGGKNKSGDWAFDARRVPNVDPAAALQELENYNQLYT